MRPHDLDPPAPAGPATHDRTDAAAHEQAGADRRIDAVDLPLLPERAGAGGPLERLDDLLDRTGLSVRGAAAVALLIGLLVGVILWLLRPPPVDVDDVLPLADPTSLAVPTTVPADLVVHVAGAVGRPGIVVLPPDSRVVDALAAAGGALPEADLDRLNLAAPVSDGSRIHVPRPGEPSPSDETTGGGGPLDLNAAGLDDLDGLPGIGPATAQAIIDHRERFGPFRSVDGLLDVRGIGEAKLAQLRPLVRV